MSEHQKQTILRFALIFFGILAMFGAVVVKIVYIQTVEREAWEQRSQQNRVNITRPIPAIRGNIYDANMQLLASSIPQFSIHMDTRVEALHLGGDTLFWQYVDTLANGFSRIIGDKSATEYRNVMVSAFRGQTKRDIRLTYKRISYTQRKAIEQLPLVSRGVYKSGVYFVDLNRRSKPFGSLGSRTIGTIYGESGKGTAGLEKHFDDYLRGKDGLSSRQRVAGHWEYLPLREAENGADVYTTLDAHLLDVCEISLRKQLHKTRGDWGCVVLMEVKTGEIKALCNLDLDPSIGDYVEKENHAVTRVEPGSTFKTIALMAALDDNKVAIGDSIEVWRNGWQYHNSYHYDAHPANTTYSVRDALAISSNIALAQIITRGYEGSAKKFIAKLERMGLSDSVDYMIPGAQQALLNIPNDTVTISKMSYGYSVEMSPMQMAMFYNGIANGGKMISPLLVRKVCQGEKVLESYKTSVVCNRLCSSQTLADIQDCLHDVVWDNEFGTASVTPWKTPKAQSKYVAIAGKTGTAQVFDGKYHSNRHRITFVGYFPEDNPQYTCICVINEPKGYYDSGMDCGTVVRTIAEKTMAYTGKRIIEGDSILLVSR